MATNTNKSSHPPINSIAIAGAGGIGAFVIAGLHSYGAIRDQFPYTGIKIDIFDDDKVDLTNMLHQNFTMDEVGKDKATLCAKRYDADAVVRFMTEKDFENYDVIFSCVDSMSFRKTLYEYGWKHPELFWIDGRCSSRQIGIYHSRLARKSIECDLTDSKVRTGCLLAVDKANHVSHATPQIVASIMVQTFLNYIRDDLDTQTEKIVMMV